MRKNKIIFFLGCFAVSFFVIYAVTFRQHAKQEEVLNSEASVIHEEVLSKFELFIDSLISKGVVTSEYFSQGTLYTKNYEALAGNIVQSYDEILGINILDDQGNIIRVYPYQENKRSLGKRSQNYLFMKDSYDKGEEFWISPPFTLYQGPKGFAIYIPIKRDEKLIGWVAPVISNDLFFKKFIKADFLKSYELVIQDQETGEAYFSTGNPAKAEDQMKRQIVKIRGRSLVFLSWPKTTYSESYLWPLSIFMALIISALTTYLYSLLEYKFHSNMQTEDVEQLLRTSIQDASSGMILIQNQLELMKLGAGHISPERVSLHAMYISNLLEQVKILQRIANQDESTKLYKTPLFPLLMEVTDRLSESIHAKNISIEMDAEKLKQINLYLHKALFKDSVLINLINHIIYHVGSESVIHVTAEIRKKNQLLSFEVLNHMPSSDFKEKMKSERALIGIRRVLALHQSHFDLEATSNGKLIFNIVMPLVK